ncbi:MAG: MBL fold metallo-hydrolase [Dehalococcoidia bacterium]|nr:MBL fold metallo-hydrolase [Dehalococcoidia bacterium]
MIKPISIGKIKVYLLWFDSMGAKSSSILIETPDVKILVDPGAAELQPGYPLAPEEKKKLRQKALGIIKKAAKKADIVFISHYHYDHHTLPSELSEIYEGKKLWIKDPNGWINKSQWERARLFLNQICEIFAGKMIEQVLQSPKKMEITDPLKDLPLAMGKDFGDYAPRREELLTKGKAWFEELAALWKGEFWVNPFAFGTGEVFFADGKEVKLGSTMVRFSPPLFHGVELDQLGWVIGMVLKCQGAKILYSSDLQGPIIEDYADWIVKENPDILILDGPATYLLGYMLNQANFRRTILNLNSILQNTSTQIIICDHHLPRDIHFKERMAKVYDMAKEKGKTFITAAEWLGLETPMGESR